MFFTKFEKITKAPSQSGFECDLTTNTNTENDNTG